MKKIFYSILPFAVCALFFFAPTARAAITFDASSTKVFSSGATTWGGASLTVGTGSNQILVITLTAGGATTSSISVVVDGSNATKAVNSTGATNRDAEIWYVLGLASGVHNVTATFGTNVSGALGLSSFFGVSQSAPLDATSSASIANGTPSSTITTNTVNDIVIDAMNSGSATTTAIGGSQTNIYKNTGNANQQGTASYLSATSAGQYVSSYTLSTSSVQWRMVQAAFKPSCASGYTWLGSVNANWSQAGNWSGCSVPGSGNVALFSASSSNNVTIDTSTNVLGFTMASGYGGTITQSSGMMITVGNTGFSESSGTFIGSASSTDSIIMNGPFTLTSGAFTSTMGTLIIASSSATFLPSFNHNNGTVAIQATSTTITGSSTFNNLQFGFSGQAGGVVATVATGTVLAVNASTTFNTAGGLIFLGGGGEIDAKGDVMMGIAGGPGPYYESSTAPTSTFNLVLNGAGTQNVSNGLNTQSNGTSPSYPLWLPSLTITKSSGVINFGANIGITGNWTNNTSTAVMNPQTSTIQFAAQSSTITGSSTFYGVRFGQVSDPYNNFLTVATGTVLTVQSSTYFDPAGGGSLPLPELLGGGEVDAAGNVYLSAQESSIGANTALLVLNGTSTQTLNDQGYSSYSAHAWTIPSLKIKKSSGVASASAGYLYLGAGAGASSSLTVAQGELRLAGAAAFTVGSTGSVTVSAGAMLSDIPTATSSLYFPGTVTNNGNVFFSGDGLGCGTAPNYVVLTATGAPSTSSTWSGSGNTFMRYVAASYQAASGAAITDTNGTNNGNNVNWTFPTGARPQLFQSTSTSGGAGTTQLTPSFAWWPGVGDAVIVAVSAANQSIAAPTDNAGNTYTIVASSTWGSSPSYALSLYYAKNITPSSSLTVTISGTGGSGTKFLSGAIFEYAGLAPSSTFDTYSANLDTSGSATSLTSYSATGRSSNEIYFGTMTFAASTTASSGSGWTSRAGITNNSTAQALYTEDIATSTLATLAATWTAATSTSYAAILGAFRSVYSQNYYPTGTVDSAPFDTQISNASSGAQLNSFSWQGTQPAGTSVKFQFAVATSSSGPWNFKGPDGTANTYFSGNVNTSVGLYSTSNGYALFSGYRYFEYRVTLFADSANFYSPTVTGVSVNWSP